MSAFSANTLLVGVVAVEDAVDDDRLGLQTAGFAGVVGPGDLQLLDVLAVDLLEAGVADLLRAAAVEPRRARGSAMT